ncbi:MAG: type II toxin-antitoxin system RelE/ParE family toxin [Calditrichaeota bacterium]|nr:type II toxin-antitoxin system RelE/ParE family toxin [Calditrichota bacterium]
MDVRYYVMKVVESQRGEWLYALPSDALTRDEGMIELLAERGNDLRRPHIDYLKSGIYELRWRVHKRRFRLLLCLHRGVAFLLHGIIKRSNSVPSDDIARAIKRRQELIDRYK